jgi:hypothetical protein
MQSAIENMIKKGLKNISDETARAYLEHLAGLGDIQINGKRMTASGLQDDYKDFANAEFKEAGKAIAKVAKKKQPNDVAKPKRAKSAYTIFCEETRPKLREEGLTDFAAVTKRLSELWKDKSTKEKYAALALQLKSDAESSMSNAHQDTVVQKTIAVKKNIDTASTVKFATTAAKKWAADNLDDADLNSALNKEYATGKDGAFKLADLKKLHQEIAMQKLTEADEEEEFEEEAEEFEEGEEFEEEAEDNEEDPTKYIGWSCKVWNHDEDDWEYGEVIKYNAKKSTHLVKFDNSQRDINIKDLQEIEEFEWDD